MDRCSHGSRNERAKTLCEPFHRKTAKDGSKVGADLGMRETLERHGILTLPPVREDHVRDRASAPLRASASDPQPEIVAPRSELRSLRVEPVPDTGGRPPWNTFADRHPYLGYPRPFGAQVRSFVTDRQGRWLGCIRFEAATKTLPCRDRGIGWTDRRRDRDRNRNRHRRTVHSRHLVFPWVVSNHRAPSTLALATRRLADDWERSTAGVPSSSRTFVDETRFRASCSRAAHWERIGDTAGRGMSRKGVYVRAHCEGDREILRSERGGARPKPATRAERGCFAIADRRCSKRRETRVAAPAAIAERADARGQRRRRVFHRLLILRFVLRLVAASRGPGYGTMLSELREPCEAAGIELPQAEPPAASTACAAREKPDEAAFRRLHAEILTHGPEGTLWKGHRILAVDGSKITQLGELARYDYRVSDGAHDPQGRVRALYRIHGRIPADFDRFDHETNGPPSSCTSTLLLVRKR